MINKIELLVLKLTKNIQAEMVSLENYIKYFKKNTILYNLFKKTEGETLPKSF